MIRNAFIYDPSTVQRVGRLEGAARQRRLRQRPRAAGPGVQGGRCPRRRGLRCHHQPLQVQERRAARLATTSTPAQGGFNADRIRQATALADFADEFSWTAASRRSSSPVTSTPTRRKTRCRSSTAAGYTKLESDQTGETSYSFSGLSGSLDHVLVNAAALPAVNGRRHLGHQRLRVGGLPVQPVQLQRDRAVRGQQPVRLLRPQPGDRRHRHRSCAQIQILGINDFHGRIANNPPVTRPGAAVLAGAVKQMRAQNPDTVFAAAGDLIGASTFESFIQQDKPTIDALNAAGLDVSAVGNHEFDQGYDDLVNRVMAPYDPTTNPFGGAEWEYIGANVKFKADGSDALDGDLDPGLRRRRGRLRRRRHRAPARAGLARAASPTSRSPTSWQATNAAANELKDGRRRHRGPARPRGRGRPPRCASAVDPASDFGKIVNGVNKNIDAIISGHTHLAYNHAVPVPAWAAEGRAVTKRPVVSAGQYGMNLNRLRFQRRRRHRPGAAASARTCVDLKGGTDVAELPGRPDDGRHRGRPPWPRPTSSARSRWVRSPDRSTGRSWPTARRRTAVASPRSATWSPRCSGGRPSRRRPGPRRSPS